jgi:hypothetical protein
MSRRIKAGAVVGAAVLTVVLVASSRDQQLRDGDIIVSKHDVKGADFPKVRVEGVVDAEPSRVFELLRDCDGSQRLNSRVSESHVVSREGADVICSETIDMPFPFKDMVTVTRWRFQDGPPVWKRSWSAIEGDFYYSNGSWTLKTFDGGRTLAVYENHFHPKMAVPDWLAKAFLKVGMPDLIKDLRKAARKR